MRYIFFFLFFMGVTSNSFSQREIRKKYFFLWYCDGKYLEISSNKQQLDLKEGVASGHYMFFYDKKYRDTALIASVSTNGLVQGVLMRYDKKGKYLWDKCEYRDGKMHGLRYTYVKIKDTMYENIYRYEDNILMETIKEEW